MFFNVIFVEDRKMKKVLVMCLVVSLFSAASAAALWEDDMSSLALWGQASDSTVEYNAGDGGIYEIDYDGDTFLDAVQYNSWQADSLSTTAGWTDSWADTGIIIADETEYTLTVRMESYVGGGQAVPFSLQADWGVVASGSPVVADGAMADYSIIFSTIGAANDAQIGKTIEIGISPGWWNNLAVDNVAVVPEPCTMLLLGLGGLVTLRRKR
jgi:hypothetical protein